MSRPKSSPAIMNLDFALSLSCFSVIGFSLSLMLTTMWCQTGRFLYSDCCKTVSTSSNAPKPSLPKGLSTPYTAAAVAPLHRLPESRRYALHERAQGADDRNGTQPSPSRYPRPNGQTRVQNSKRVRLFDSQDKAVLLLFLSQSCEPLNLLLMQSKS